MLALSAIRQMMPAAGAVPSPIAERLGAGSPIPAAELKSLSAGASLGTLPAYDLRPVCSPAGIATSAPVGGSSFANVLGRLVTEVNAKQAAAGDAIRSLQSGENVPLHQAVLAMEEASVSFQLMVEVRNKLLESYQELMRMQI
jgi:flagellar hook-basal body complex protein FliE